MIRTVTNTIATRVSTTVGRVSLSSAPVRGVAHAAHTHGPNSPSNTAPPIYCPQQSFLARRTSIALASRGGITKFAGSAPANTSVWDVTFPDIPMPLSPFPEGYYDPEDLGVPAVLEDPLDTSNSGHQCIKRTYQPSALKRRRTHGFLRRLKSKAGRRVLKRRMAKGRKYISVG